MSGGLTLRGIAQALGGEVVRDRVLAPGPGRPRDDRSLSIGLSHQAPLGFFVSSRAGDELQACRDHVAQRLGLQQASPTS